MQHQRHVIKVHSRSDSTELVEAVLIGVCPSIRAFDGRSFGSQWSYVSSCAKLRLWSDCDDAQTDLNLSGNPMPSYTG